MDEILTLKEVAAFLKVVEKTVYTLARRGDLPGFKVRGQWRFHMPRLQAWVDAQHRLQLSSPDVSVQQGAIDLEEQPMPSYTFAESEDGTVPLAISIGDAYEIDERSYQLRQTGIPIAIEPKAFEVLVYLIRHRNRVVTKGELLNQLWPRQVVTESSLTQCVAKARKALRHAAVFSPIRSVYGRGYRFVLPVFPSHSQKQLGRTATSPSQSVSLNTEATTYFVRGRDYMLQFTPEALCQARNMYERAIALDSRYVAAYAALAWTYLLEWIWLWHHERRPLDRAVRLAQRAVTLDGSSAVAHLTIGYVSLFRGQHEQAITETRHSLALDPSSALAHAALAEMLVGVGQPQEAIPLLEKAMHLQPQSAALFSSSLGLAYHALRRYEEALTALRYSLKHNPNFPSARFLLAVVCSEMGHHGRARKELSTLRRLVPDLSVERLRVRLPYQDSAVTERVVAMLRKVGLS